MNERVFANRYLFFGKNRKTQYNDWEQVCTFKAGIRHTFERDYENRSTLPRYIAHTVLRAHSVDRPFTASQLRDEPLRNGLKPGMRISAGATARDLPSSTRAGTCSTSGTSFRRSAVLCWSN